MYTLTIVVAVVVVLIMLAMARTASTEGRHGLLFMSLVITLAVSGVQWAVDNYHSMRAEGAALRTAAWVQMSVADRAAVYETSISHPTLATEQPLCAEVVVAVTAGLIKLEDGKTEFLDCGYALGTKWYLNNMKSEIIGEVKAQRIRHALRIAERMMEERV